MQTLEWKEDYQEFAQATRQFYHGEISAAEYKKISGGFGSYAQRDKKSSMLRLRLPGGRINREKLEFIINAIDTYKISKIHFTTCQTVQLHNLNEQAVCELAEQALDYGIITRGGGGDFPRNVMVSPLSGVEKGEYFDVFPYASAVSEYLLHILKTIKLPRKLKVGFSNSKKNETHVTFRDLGFAAREDKTFDVYSGGGLGNHHKMGVLVAEGVPGSQVLYYVQAMVQMFVTYGNYENRSKARTRYMQDKLGSEYRAVFNGILEEVMRQQPELELLVKEEELCKKADGTRIQHTRALEQKQEGLYTVLYHPIGGCPSPETLKGLLHIMQETEGIQMRLGPEETAYLVNCTGKEAQKILEMTKDSAQNALEASVACIGASICQIGLRDSQKLLQKIVEAQKTWGYEDGVLPRLHISGCPSSCGTHQIGQLGFRGSMKKVDGKPQPAYLLYVNGEEVQGRERFGEEGGVMLEEDIPAFLKELGSEVSKSGMQYEAWYKKEKERFWSLVKKYTEQS